MFSCAVRITIPFCGRGKGGRIKHTRATPGLDVYFLISDVSIAVAIFIGDDLEGVGDGSGDQACNRKGLGHCEELDRFVSVKSNPKKLWRYLSTILRFFLKKNPIYGIKIKVNLNEGR